MNIKNFALGSGIKKNKKFSFIKTTGIALILAGFLAEPAYAYVPLDDFIGEEQYYDTHTESRTETKLIEAQTIENLFNNCTERTITLDEIRKAITLSDVLNTYYPGPTELSNTDVDEIVNLDINDLYRKYTRAVRRGKELEFCANHIGDLASIDAFTLFSCRTVTNELKISLANRIASIVAEEGYIITSWPTIEINANESYAIIGTKKGYLIYRLEGKVIEEVKSMITILESQYTTAINNANGTSSLADNAFRVNGVNPRYNTTVYLTFGDSDRKELLTNAINLIGNIQTQEDLEFTKTASSTITISEPPKLSKELNS